MKGSLKRVRSASDSPSFGRDTRDTRDTRVTRVRFGSTEESSGGGESGGSVGGEVEGEGNGSDGGSGGGLGGGDGDGGSEGASHAMTTRTHRSTFDTVKSLKELTSERRTKSEHATRLQR